MDVEVKKLNDKEIEEMGIKSWPIWEKEVSQFDWSYSSEERCLILEGRALITYGDKNVEIKKGDFVIFPKGLQCKWNITEPIKKHYNFF